jgi:hypothetical protein
MTLDADLLDLVVLVGETIEGMSLLVYYNTKENNKSRQTNKKMRQRNGNTTTQQKTKQDNMSMREQNKPYEVYKH